jgi:hypothetical protein
VINSIISPIHESYKAQEFRLFQKQQRLNDSTAALGGAERVHGFSGEGGYEIDSARAVTPPTTPPGANLLWF